MKQFMFICFLCLFGVLPIHAERNLQDSLEIGLMTCEPGQEVYALYGHTAIRVKNHTSGEDWVFNYGMFSFQQPHFLWRFVRGECDYQIGAVPFEYFAREYRERGSSVYQQTLNLTTSEKNRLWLYLMKNMLPENRTYRYNFLYDNCTTRARDVIEGVIEGKVLYATAKEECTYRRILHEYTKEYPWNELGNDICLGAEADQPITFRQEMFAPFYMMRYADQAVIVDDSLATRTFVLSTDEVVKGLPVSEQGTRYPSPALCAWLLLTTVILLTLIENHFHKVFWWMDAVFMTIVGVIGIVVTFLFFFSSHPTVGSNWQIWVFNPLPLLAMPYVVWCAMKKRKTCYHAVNACILIFFILFSPIIPQKICSVIVPLALILLLRSCSYVVSYHKKTRNPNVK